MPKLPPTPSPLALLTETIAKYLPDANQLLPPSMMEAAIKFKDLAFSSMSEFLTSVSKLSHNQATFVTAVIMGCVAFSVVMYFVLSYVLRSTLKKFGMEFKRIHFSILRRSFGFSDLVIHSNAPIMGTILCAILPSAAVQQLESSEDFPLSRLDVGKFRIKLQAGSLSGKFRDDNEKSWAQKLKIFIGGFIPRPMISIEIYDAILTIEKAYLAPEAPVEFAGEKLPFSIPPSEERDPKIPVFSDQDALLVWLRDFEFYDAEATTFWVERWIHHVASRMKYAQSDKTKDYPTDDEKTNSTMKKVFRTILHSLSIQLINSALVISGADGDTVKKARENRDPMEANLILAKLPKSKRGLSIIGAEKIEIGLSSDEDCNLYLCCAGVQVKSGSPYKAKGGEMTIDWHSIAHPFDVVVEFKGLIDILIWALNYDHHFDVKSIDLLITASEVALSLSPNHLHTLLIHLEDWLDGNSPFCQWYMFLYNSHYKTIGGRLTDEEKLAYCDSYPSIKAKKAKKTKGSNARQLLSAEQMKELERNMTTHEIMSLRCFAMKQIWKIPKDSEEFAHYLKSSGSSIVELTDPLQDSPCEILVPFEQKYASPLHALVTLVRWKNAVASLLKIRYVANQIHIDLPSDFADIRAKIETSKRRVPTCLTSTSFELDLEKRDALLHIPDSVPLENRRTTLKIGLSIEDVNWDVVGLDNTGEKLPTLKNNEPVGIIYQQNEPTSENALSIDLNMEVAPKSTQDTTISLYLTSSDMIIVCNPIPLLSSMQTLLEASAAPFQIIEEAKPAESVTTLAEKNQAQQNQLDMVLSKDELDCAEEAPQAGPLDALATDIDIKVEQISIVFLLNGASSMCQDILHLGIKDIGVELDSNGMSGVLVLAAEPFELCPGQVITTDNHPFDLKLLPFKPIASIQGVRLVLTTKETHNKSETILGIDVKQGIKAVEISASPLTLAALNGAIDSLQPFVAPDEEYEKQLEAEKQAKLDEYRSNVLRQRQELINLFNLIDKDQSHTLQDYELAELIRMMLEKSSASDIPTTDNASGPTLAEFNREKSFLLAMLDSKGLNEVTLPDLEMILYQMATGIDDCNLRADIGTTGISYFDNISKSKYFLSGPTLWKLIKFDDLKEYTAMHHVFRITGHDDIEKKSVFPALSTWSEGGIDMFWNQYTSETGCSRDSLNGQDIKSVQRKLVRSLCNYEFAKFCWKALVQPEFYSANTPPEHMENVAVWQLDNDHKCKLVEGVMSLLLKHLRDTSIAQTQQEATVSSTSKTNYALSLNFVIDTVTLGFGSSHANNSLIEIQFSQISLSSSALLSESGWFLPDGEDRNKINFRSIMSAHYLNTKHNHMETAIESYPCYGSLSYKVDLPDVQNSDGSETSSFSVYLFCPRMLNIELGLSLLETASVMSNALSPKDSANSSSSSASLFSGSQMIQIKNSTGREIKVSTQHMSVKGLLPGYDQSFTSIAVDGSASFPLPDDNAGLSFYTDRYKMIENVAMSPYQPMMFPLLRRKKQGKSKQTQNLSGFGSFLTLVPTSDSLDSITVEARSCVTIQTQIPVNLRIVRLSKSLGYLSKRGMKSVIDLSKKNLVPALKRLVKGALIIWEKTDIVEGISCAVPADLFNSAHYYALLIQDITGSNQNKEWRDPILLTQDYLFNTMGIPDVARSHSMSGIFVKKERLNVQILSNRRKVKDMLLRTAWDTSIFVVPTFILSNSMPFPLTVRIWQFMETDVDTVWFDQTLVNEEDDSSGDENQSSSMASTWISNMESAQYHNPPEGNSEHYFSEESVGQGQSVKLSGINLQRRLFIQVSQNVKTAGVVGAKHIWSTPLQIDLQKLRTGANKKGSFSLPKRVLNLGDNADALVEASVDVETGMPNCTIYSPYWVMNKTGMKMEYKVSGDPRRFIDSGNGGLPVMFHGGYNAGGAVQTNAIYKKSSCEASCIPIECPKYELLSHWWDESSSGSLVLKNGAIKNSEGNKHRVGWSEEIEMDTAGTSGKLNCNRYVLSVKIDSQAGAFYKSNVITLGPHFILKNLLHIPVTVIPLIGSKQDAIRMSKKLRLNPELLSDERINLAPEKSTVVYSFHDTSSSQPSSNKWVAFTVNAARSKHTFMGKWHLIPIETAGSTYYGEHDGLHSTMCGILEVKAHSSDGGSMAISISHAANPPFFIENRSNTHFLQFAQDDDDATVFELAPMHSCGYTWDSPLGNLRLRATVVRKQAHHCASIDDLYRIDETQEYNGSVTSVAASRQSSMKSKRFSSFRRSKGAGDNSSDSIGEKTGSSRGSSSVLQKFKSKFDTNSRSYSMSRVGRKKDLPTKSSSHHLHAHLRIIAGTKILSFNDSDYLGQQVESGIMRKGGSFKSALLETSIEGMQLTILDTFPKELLGITVRDIQIVKPRGSIEATFRVRHFQVDAMLPTARYPIIIQPLPLGVDRRNSVTHADVSEEQVEKKDCYWMKHGEKPVPVLEIVGSYVPQTNMVWIPNLYVMISPCQVNVDVEYLLGIIGMMLESVSKSDIASGISIYCPIKHANAPLTFITQGQTQACLTYLEKLYIAPVYFDIELDIKDESQEAEEGALTMNAIARSTNSTAAAGILAWILNVGSNFAHVSPTFKYSDISYEDKYCDIADVIYDIVVSYVIESIKQSYKVIFSMHLLGDPSQLAHEWKTGVTDLVSKTRDEVKAGGKEGAGQGFASFLQHAVGGTFFWMGKLSGSWAKTIDSVISNDTTSSHLKPDFANYRNRPKNAPEGLVQATTFVGKTVIYGVAGLIGNPYRGAKAGGIVGGAKGAVTGVVGAFSVIFVAPLGFVAKTTEGLGAQTKTLEIGVINTRCRPIRSVPWGCPMMDNGLSYMKAIGIRVHCVRYQKIRKQVAATDTSNADDDTKTRSSKELKRIRTAEERRNNPPRKIVTMLYSKDKHFYSTYPMTPKLLPDQPQNDVLSHYAVVFQDTILIRVSDLQLGDEVTVQFRNNKAIKTAGKTLGTCKISVGDMYSYILKYYRESMIRNDARLAKNVINDSDELFNPSHIESDNDGNMVIPPPQEYSLFRSPKKISAPATDILDLARQELISIQRDAEEQKEEDDDEFVSPDSMFNIGKKSKKDEPSGSSSANERLFGNISLSFFPIAW